MYVLSTKLTIYIQIFVFYYYVYFLLKKGKNNDSKKIHKSHDTNN